MISRRTVYATSRRPGERVDQRLGVAQHDASAAVAEGADEARQIGQRPLRRPFRERAKHVRLARDVASPEPRMELAERARARRGGEVLAREQAQLAADGLLVGGLLEERLGAPAVRARERIERGDHALSPPGFDPRCAHRRREGADDGVQVLQAVLGERGHGDHEAVGERGIHERVDDGRRVPVPGDDGHGAHPSRGDVPDRLQARSDDVIQPLHARDSRHTQRRLRCVEGERQALKGGSFLTLLRIPSRNIHSSAASLSLSKASSKSVSSLERSSCPLKVWKNRLNGSLFR